jgi:hypothetical protein
VTSRVAQVGLSCGLAMFACGPAPLEDPDSPEALFERAGEACNRACAHEADCFGTDFVACFDVCYEELEGPDEVVTADPCTAAGLDFWECPDQLTCDELAQLKSGAPSPCAELEEVKDEACE